MGRRKLLESRTYIAIRAATVDFLRDEKGQDLVEYAIVVALISLAATASMSTVAKTIANSYSKIGSRLSNYIP